MAFFFEFFFHLAYHAMFIHISHFVIDLHSIDEIIICIIVTEQLLSSLKTGTMLDNETIRKYRMSLT